MYFQAESNGVQYEINVSERADGWRVSIKPPTEDWKHFAFSKNDYQYMDDTISFLFKNTSYLLDVTATGVDYTVYTRGAFRTVKIYNEEKLLHESLKSGKSLGVLNGVTSEMPGKIVKLYVKPGDKVKEGDPLLIMEAMKMENEIRAGSDVTIKEVFVKEGVNVESNVLLVSFETKTNG